MTEPKTATGKALLEMLGDAHRYLLRSALEARPEDKFDWADILGELPVERVKEALPLIEAEAAALERERLLGALSAHRIYPSREWGGQMYEATVVDRLLDEPTP